MIKTELTLCQSRKV